MKYCIVAHGRNCWFPFLGLGKNVCCDLVFRFHAWWQPDFIPRYLIFHEFHSLYYKRIGFKVNHTEWYPMSMGGRVSSPAQPLGSRHSRHCKLWPWTTTCRSFHSHGDTQNGWFIINNILWKSIKMDELGVPPISVFFFLVYTIWFFKDHRYIMIW